MQTPGLMGIASTAVARGAGLNQLKRGGRHLVANSWGQVLSGLVRQVGTFGREFTEYSCWSGRCSFCSGCGSCHRHPVQYAILSTGEFNLLVLKSNKDIWGRGNPQTYENFVEMVKIMSLVSQVKLVANRRIKRSILKLL